MVYAFDWSGVCCNARFGGIFIAARFISSQSLNLGGRRGTTDDIATLPFHPSLSSASRSWNGCLNPLSLSTTVDNIRITNKGGAVEILYAVPRNSFICHLILWLFSNKNQRSDWHNYFSVWRDTVLKTGNPLTKNHTILFHVGSLFTKWTTLDAFMPLMSLHMQCTKDKWRFNGWVQFIMLLVLKKPSKYL